MRGGGGAVSASIRRRRVGCLDRPPRAAPHRRCDGAPASPLRYSASRACRTSVAGTPRASRRWAFVASCSAADEVRDEWDVACAALNLRRLRVLGVAAASLARGGSPLSGTAQYGSGDGAPLPCADVSGHAPSLPGSLAPLSRAANSALLRVRLVEDGR